MTFGGTSRQGESGGRKASRFKPHCFKPPRRLFAAATFAMFGLLLLGPLTEAGAQSPTPSPASSSAPTRPAPAAAAPPSAPSPVQTPAQTPATETPAEPPSSRPGLIDAIGKWIDQSKDDVADKLRGAQQSIEQLNTTTGDAAKAAGDAARGLTTLPGTSMVSGHALCVPAANGAPDCKAAADELCRSKGRGVGRSVDTETAENCPVQVLLSGRKPQPGECKMETFVTRAVCQ